MAKGSPTRRSSNVAAYWHVPVDALCQALGASTDGLSQATATDHLARYGKNTLREAHSLSRLPVLLAQLKSPLLLLLVAAAGVSGASGHWVDAAIVFSIVVASAGIGYSREYSAQAAILALRARVHMRVRVQRNATTLALPPEQVVPGDVVLLAAGSLVPADGVLLEATDFYVSEAVLTGESFPVEKTLGLAPADAPIAKRRNCVFLGTNVRSGTGRCLVVNTGPATELGAIAHRLTLRPPETEFERGLRRFGYLLTIAMLVLVLGVFGAHALRGRPAIETLLFSIALAVGLSPELLPAILSVSLASGARMMAKAGVLVRRLSAIENLGSMDILCTDKTGTLTEGVVTLEGAYDPTGAPSPAVLGLAAINASLETGLATPLDDAIVKAQPAAAAVEKLAEIPFDFTRKRVTVVVRAGEGARLITKGAFHHVLEVCEHLADGTALSKAQRATLEARYDAWSAAGIRVLAVATKDAGAAPAFSRHDEVDLCFAGFLTFVDHPKTDAKKAIAALSHLGVAVKVITGDSLRVAQHVAKAVGLRETHALTGEALDNLHDEALWREAERTDIFAEVNPNQKERIILALKKMGHVVGFLGDGVNDAPAMHAADTSLAVEGAVDVAREAADFVLLERDLDVIRRGVEEGRRTFANTMKYILTTTSANLGNMLSMAVASLFLPFLPLTAGQILLNNFLSDIPAVGMAGDRVDPELVEQPERWNIRFIGRFMAGFGVLSSVFDLLTFAALLVVFKTPPEVFRTGWFVESLLTELLIALVVRSRRPLWRSRPGNVLLAATLLLVPVTLLIPWLPGATILGFVPLPLPVLLVLGGITALYVLAAELLKRRLLRAAGR